MPRTFFTATDQEILEGRTTDVYFQRTLEILEARGLADVPVVADVTAGGLPRGWPWAVLLGLEESLRLLEGHDVTVRALPEGTLFRPRDVTGVPVPAMILEGGYGAFCLYETPLLGFLCQGSGIATATARCRLAAGDLSMLSFGVRRMHPALAPVIDRACYLGGADGVSAVLSAERLGLEPQGTMPHALVIAFGDQQAAWRAFDEVIDPSVSRVALVDTYLDETVEAVMAAETLGERLAAVRLDTHSSRRGNLPHIVREVRWELDRRGYEAVDVFVSGGLDETTIPALVEAGADGLGVGTSLSNAPTVNFALDIVERDGEPVAKRGKFSGRKDVHRCRDCQHDTVTPAGEEDVRCARCGGATRPMLETVLDHGERVGDQPDDATIRERVLEQLAALPPDERPGR